MEAAEHTTTEKEAVQFQAIPSCQWADRRRAELTASRSQHCSSLRSIRLPITTLCTYRLPVQELPSSESLWPIPARSRGRSRQSPHSSSQTPGELPILVRLGVSGLGFSGLGFRALGLGPQASCTTQNQNRSVPARPLGLRTRLPNIGT